jgi:hypothetical protein
MILTAQAAAAEVEFVSVLWTPPEEYPAVLKDIASRLPADTNLKEPCPITYAHEGSHGLAKGKPGYHGLYVLNGIRIYIPTPPITLADVFGSVPANERGAIYETYRRQGENEYWALQPLMLVDEWVAYTHGSLCRLELRRTNRQESDRHCAEMSRYVHRMYEIAKGIGSYPIKDLREFCRWNLDRCRGIPRWAEMSSVTFD